MYSGDLLLHLASFRALALQLQAPSAGAFERTARGLHVDRSVLRRRIQSIVDWAGVPLLRGRGARLELTDAGRALEAQAAQLIATAERLPSALREAPAHVLLGCTGTITASLLPALVRTLESVTPAIRIAVRRAGGLACERAVLDGTLDVGVVRAEAPPSGLEVRALGPDRLWLVTPHEHPLAGRARPTLARLAREPLILYGESSRTRARVMQVLGPLGAVVRVEVDGKSAALEFVEAGLGVTFLSSFGPTPPTGPSSGKGRFAARDVTASFGEVSFFAIARRDRAKEPSIAQVLDGLGRRAQKASRR